jgi:IS5 family transposase
MACFVRLMVIKQRTGWGYQTLVREVSDSLRLRRFCRLPLTQRVPDERPSVEPARRPMIRGISVVDDPQLPLLTPP